MTWWIELLRLAAQLVGAIVVAKLAVRWALDRFKSEKLWERQATALVDVVTAMGAMERVTSRWLDDFYSEDGSTTEEYKQQLRQLHRDAQLKLQEVSAAARLILPRDIADHIRQTDGELESHNECPNYDEALGLDLRVLRASSDALIKMGRRLFDADLDGPPDPIRHPWAFYQYRNAIRLSYADKQ
ncbi:hypothetical protein [Rhizobium sp. N4311]|uniref:hypothetical protein n=1 Tax=Rhizobium sp. N4311 TaxID=1703972 RepID=UPI000B95FCCF|nr:hypothetical protein [Rhizobium sp. N4311]OYD03922.1 hypothetical protein AMK08_CH101951 [Rhizobium sp. N4311]